MKKYNYISRLFDWIHKVTGGFATIEDAVAIVNDGPLCSLGIINDTIDCDCIDFYRQKKQSSLPPDLVYIACQYIDQNRAVIDSQGVFSCNSFDISITTDDKGVYEELPKDYEMFHIKEGLVLIAEIMTLWTSGKRLARRSTLHSLKSVEECGFFMVDDTEFPWTIHLVKNNGKPYVMMDGFDETDILWSKGTVVLSPLSVSDEDYPHSLES